MADGILTPCNMAPSNIVDKGLYLLYWHDHDIDFAR